MTEPVGEGSLLWTPSPAKVAAANLTDFLAWLGDRGQRFDGYDALWQWSVTDLDGFWQAIWDYCGIQCSAAPQAVLGRREMPGAQWFPGALLNYAEHILRNEAPGQTALLAVSETASLTAMDWADLAGQVRILATQLRVLGVGTGDRVVAYLPNIPQTVVAMLATTAIGAIWASCSPDFGWPGVLDRFRQLEPKVLICVDGYQYGGRRFDRTGELRQIVAGLESLQQVIFLPYLEAEATAPTGEALYWADVLDADPVPAADFSFEQVPFSHPLWILFSSGTTGLPKPIVHSHGGIVLEHLKALALHQDLTSRDSFFWYTTTGWMMWNYLVGGLLVGATIVLYDGSAVYPDTGALWRLVADAGVTYAGTGAPYLLACMKEGLRPAAENDLSALRGVGSTGSPLPPEGFRWAYQELGTGSSELILGSLSGGTDLCTGFVGPSPLLPVRAG
ncbi:MAG TPA: acetoacetate--CoA ligase, partial [Streptosporangiaceae bacterium]